SRQCLVTWGLFRGCARPKEHASASQNECERTDQQIDHLSSSAEEFSLDLTVDFESCETASIAESAQCSLVRCPTATRVTPTCHVVVARRRKPSRFNSRPMRRAARAAFPGVSSHSQSRSTFQPIFRSSRDTRRSRLL